MVTLDQVFGISTRLVKSYVSRPQVDGAISDALGTDKHLVVYGASKQGKTTLRQRHLPDEHCIFIHCSPTSTISWIYSTVARAVGAHVEVSESPVAHIGQETHGHWLMRALLPQQQRETADTPADQRHGWTSYDISEAQSLAELLRDVNCKRLVVLENFHYLSPEVKARLAFDLKTFHELHIRFCVLGVWKNADFLEIYNPDLSDRLKNIPVEPWTDADFDNIIVKGSQELNIIIPKEPASKFKKNAFGNVALLQEFLRVFCRLSGVESTTLNCPVLADDGLVEAAIAEKLSDLRGQLLHKLQTIAAAPHVDSKDPLLLPYYLVKVLLTSPLSEIRPGLTRPQLVARIREVHHREDKESIRTNDVDVLLGQLRHYQQEAQSPFLYYDVNSRRLIVDCRDFFVLSRSNRNELLEDVPFPIEFNR